MQQLSTVIQQNAAASEELASTAEELSAQAEQLQSLIATLIDTTDNNTRKASKATKVSPTQIQHRKYDSVPVAHAPISKKQPAREARELVGAGVKLDMGHGNGGNGHDKLDKEFEKY